MTNGYEVYNCIAQAHALVHLGCWTHCLRYFIWLSSRFVAENS